jgi:hypothetical protein
VTTSAATEVARWNEDNPVGTLVDYWRGAREGFEPSGRGRTYTQAGVLSGHTAVVWIDGCSGAIRLTHVQPVNATADLGSEVSNA